MRAWKLAAVAQRLRAEERPSVVGEALDAVRGIKDARLRAWTLAEIAQRLPVEERLSVVGEAWVALG